MARSSVTRSNRRKPAAEQKLTNAQVSRARIKGIRDGAWQVPANPFVDRDPAETLKTCRRVMMFLAAAEVHNEELDAGKNIVRTGVLEAMAYVERNLEGIWSPLPESKVRS